MCSMEIKHTIVILSSYMYTFYIYINEVCIYYIYYTCTCMYELDLYIDFHTFT